VDVGRIYGSAREKWEQVLNSLEVQCLVRVKGKTMVVYGTR